MIISKSTEFMDEEKEKNIIQKVKSMKIEFNYLFNWN